MPTSWSGFDQSKCVFERERDKCEAKETKIAATLDHQRAQTELKLMRTEDKSKELLKAEKVARKLELSLERKIETEELKHMRKEDVHTINKKRQRTRELNETKKLSKQTAASSTQAASAIVVATSAMEPATTADR